MRRFAKPCGSFGEMAKTLTESSIDTVANTTSSEYWSWTSIHMNVGLYKIIRQWKIISIPKYSPTENLKSSSQLLLGLPNFSASRSHSTPTARCMSSSMNGALASTSTALLSTSWNAVILQRVRTDLTLSLSGARNWRLAFIMLGRHRLPYTWNDIRSIYVECESIHILYKDSLLI